MIILRSCLKNSSLRKLPSFSAIKSIQNQRLNPHKTSFILESFNQNFCGKTTNYRLLYNGNFMLNKTAPAHQSSNEPDSSHKNPTINPSVENKEPAVNQNDNKNSSVQPENESQDQLLLEEEEQNLTLFQRFKKMYKEYW